MNKQPILPRESVMELPIEEQRELMKEWRSTYTVEQICKGSGIPMGGSFYNYLRYLGLPTNSSARGNKKDQGMATMNLYEQNLRKSSNKGLH